MPAELSIEVGGVTHAVRSWAADDSSVRTPLVLLPATGETAEDWDTVASALHRWRDVYAVSLRGHGTSDWPGTYSIALMAQDVTRLLDSELIRAPVDLVGHSLGGLLACQVAAERPDLVHRLVLEDVGLLQPRRADPPSKPTGVLAFDWRVIEQVRPEIDNFDPGWAEVVAAIAAPTLVVAGGPCSLVPQDQIDDLVRLLPDGHMVTIDAGHLVHATQPDAFVGQLVSFLDI